MAVSALNSLLKAGKYSESKTLYNYYNEVKFKAVSLGLYYCAYFIVLLVGIYHFICKIHTMVFTEVSLVLLSLNFTFFCTIIRRKLIYCFCLR